MTEKKDESRLRELLSGLSRLDYKELIEILHRDQKRYHSEQLRLCGVMPSKLTAENGAKALLIGEFKEYYEAYDEEEGHYNVDVPVRWDTIKDIYQKIVDFYLA